MRKRGMEEAGTDREGNDCAVAPWMAADGESAFKSRGGRTACVVAAESPTDETGLPEWARKTHPPRKLVILPATINARNEF